MPNQLTIALLYGGRSAEREVSLESGNQVAAALESLGHRVIKIDVDDSVEDKLDANQADLAFIALHGIGGEDGTIQKILEDKGIKYTGSGVLASAYGMDKIASKKAFAKHGLLTPRFIELKSNSYDEVAIKEPGWPAVVKPNSQGSSIGISIAHDHHELKKAIDEAFALGDKVLIEQFIKGREIQCGILGNEKPQALELIEIVSKKQFFDYEAKYDPSLAEEIVPAEVTPQQKQKIQEVSLKAYNALGCRGFARVDTFLTSDEQVYVSEINTIPGLTANSLFPKEAKASGIEFNELIQKIVDLALESTIERI
ncbi:MAG: D-alanine--D-alanine ligase [Actinobacteria bacterium]|nr:MAG: D-alanine--D-alanine ligase [Actinomycetota bacterium]